LVQPARPVVEVDRDHLVRDVLLGQGDADARGVRTALCVVQGQHWTAPGKFWASANPWVAPSIRISEAMAPSSSGPGGSSPGEVAVRATVRKRARSAPVRRAATVGLAPSATASPGGS